MSDYLTKIRKALEVDALLFGKTDTGSKEFKLLMDVALDRFVSPRDGKSTREFYWEAERYGLHESRYFEKLASGKQKAILKFLSDATLRSLYFLEKMGSSYAGKMILNAPTFQEKEFFSLLALDELIHRHELRHYFSHPPEETPGRSYSAQTMSKLCQSSYSVSMLFVQVVLEGFGMTNYTNLRKHCLDESLQKVFHRILKDEGRHFGGGLLLYKLSPVQDSEIEELRQLIKPFMKAADEYQALVLRAFEACGLQLEGAERDRLIDEARLPAQVQERKDLHLKHMKAVVEPELFSVIQAELEAA